MAGIQITEDKFKLSDGALIYRKTWEPSGALPVAKLIFIHGFDDHINRYYELFPTLAGRGISCTGIDQRGWGQSVVKSADKGNTGPTATVLSDVASLIESYLPSQVPVFLMGHSMGGAIVLTLCSTPKYAPLTSQLAGILLESPYLSLVTPPSSIVVFLGKMAGKLLPHQQIPQKLDLTTVSRDPEVQRSIDADPLLRHMGTLEMFANMLERGAHLTDGTLKLNKGAVNALWLAHGSGDLCTSHLTSKAWFDREAGGIEDKEYKEYKDWSHQLHADLPENRSVFAQDVGDWVLKRSSQGRPESSGQAKL